MTSPELIAELLFTGTYDRLCECYGQERANLIIKGQDAATQDDLERWNALGRCQPAETRREA